MTTIQTSENRSALDESEALQPVVVTLAAALGLRLEPAWIPTVATQLSLSMNMARILESVPIGDETEQAPIYRL